MAESSIEWTDYTFNPWIGCTKVAPGCANCYAERDFDKRRGHAKWGPSGTRVLTSDANWRKPLAWNRKAEAEGVRLKVFCASLADVFEDWFGAMLDHKGDRLCGPPPKRRPFTMSDARDRLWRLIDATPHLDWLLLTKRPENIRRMWPATGTLLGRPDGRYRSAEPRNIHPHRKNVWLLTSVATQADAEANVPELLKCRGLAPVLGLSCEPLLEAVNLRHACESDYGFSDFLGGGYCSTPRRGDGKFNREGGSLDWVIAGGESGPGARVAHPDWFRSLRDQCAAAGVPFHFKQWGEWAPQIESASPIVVTGSPEKSRVIDQHGDDGPWLDWESGGYRFAWMHRVGKKAAGRLLDGVTHDGRPTP